MPTMDAIMKTYTFCYATLHGAPKEQITGNVTCYAHGYDVSDLYG